MNVTRNTVAPLVRQRGLLTRSLDGELLVYDREADVAHCLDSVAARIFLSCDGRTTVGEIADRLRSTVQWIGDEEAVLATLLKLGDDNLLEGPVEGPDASMMTRKTLLKRAAVAGGAAMITTLAVPFASASASACLGQNTNCTPGSAPLCCSPYTCRQQANGSQYKCQ